MTTMSYHVTGRLHGRVDPDASLARAPWDGETATPDPRPETAPPRDIRGRRNGVTPEGFIALLRAECLRVRAGA